MGNRRFLLAAVFIGGISSLGIELTASRLLAPFFGTSQLIWANVIGLTLIYLTIGYRMGGRLVDRRPEERLLGTILLAAGLTTAIIPLLARPILQWSAVAFSSFSAGVFFGSLFGVLLLFSGPIILLGMVSPFAIRLSLRDVASAGSTAGTLYGLSTIGSIVGTFLPVLVLIPAIGTSRTFYFFALILVLTGALGMRRRVALLAVPAVLLLALLQLGIRGIREPFCEGCTSLYEQESSYNYIQVARNDYGPGGSEQIGLILNEGQAIHSIYNTRYAETKDPADLLTSGPWDFFNVGPYLYPDCGKDEVDGLMMIGSTAGTVPKQFLAIYGPDARIDAVEIDPAIVRVGRTYFAMEDETAPNYRTHTQDGRVYLRSADATYDVIGMDAYHQPYIPFHLTTREFFAEVAEHLTDRGVAVVNAGKPGSDYRLVHVLASTMRAVFPQVFILDVPTFGNSIVIGVKQPVGDGVANFRANMERMDDPVLAHIMGQALAGNPETGKLPLREWTAADATQRPFTDDWAPVEWVIDQLIVRAAEQGLER
ncbi:MAG TPA: fused MFS/spermidine synthase [Herpetosiphonaceae bacterium]|nr:fused MFS/spermidine synthase [Herpetosiphonaceae bacterium]